MLLIRAFINLLLAPIITLYLSKKANRKEIVFSAETLVLYAVVTSFNIPLTRVFTFIIRKGIGVNIEADSSYYTVFAIISAMVLFVVNQIFFSIKNKTKNSYYAKLLAIVLIVCLGVGSVAFASQKFFSGNTSVEEQAVSESDNKEFEKEEISWELNSDGTYTFTNNMGKEGSIYAWYILENDEPIEKTNYINDPTFTYDIKNNEKLIIKGFVRDYKDGTEEYDQKSYKISATEILKKKDSKVSEIVIPDNIDDLLEIAVNEVMASTSISADKVIKGDGSDWNTDLTLPVDWYCPNISLRSYGFRVNGFVFLDELWNEYRNTNDPEYGKLIVSYMVDWATQNEQYDEKKEWQWHDDATANRVLRWAVFYRDVQELCDDEEKNIIEKSLAYQAELLNFDWFHTDEHNHGMRQDIALIIEALLYEEGSIQQNYIEHALERLISYYDYVYTEDGIHKEHSPFYARDTLAAMKFLSELIGKSAPSFDEHIKPYIDGAGEYLVQIIMPDGTWPSLGDSSKTNGISALSIVLGDDENYKYIKEKTGMEPCTNAVFEKGGYAVFRSSWNDAPENATWLLFNAASFSSVHKHGDDLELLLYHKGDFVVEAGKRNYNYSDLQSSWAYSGYGHNVLLVDGEAFPVKVGENGFQSILPDALKTGIIDYDISNDMLPTVSGYECRFEDVEQTRTVTYDKEEGKVVVCDDCLGIRDYDGTLLWHIAEGIDVKQTETGWDCYREDELLATISLDTDADYQLETVVGEGEYPYATWIFEGYDEARYGSLLKVNFSGTKGETELITNFILY